MEGARERGSGMGCHERESEEAAEARERRRRKRSREERGAGRGGKRIDWKGWVHNEDGEGHQGKRHKQKRPWGGIGKEWKIGSTQKQVLDIMQLESKCESSERRRHETCVT